MLQPTIRRFNETHFIRTSLQPSSSPSLQVSRQSDNGERPHIRVNGSINSPREPGGVDQRVEKERGRQFQGTTTEQQPKPDEEWADLEHLVQWEASRGTPDQSGHGTGSRGPGAQEWSTSQYLR